MLKTCSSLLLGLIMATSTIEATELTPEALDWDAKLAYMTQVPVQDKGGAIVEFKPNWLQRRMYAAMESQMRAVGKVRLLLLKGRRGGASEGVTRLFDEETTRFANRFAAVASNDTDGTVFLWEKLERIINEKPAALKRQTKSGRDFTKTSIHYARPHSSLFRMFTAGTQTKGRGGEHHYFHGSEVAWWRNGKQFWASMGKTIADLPGTIVVWETTANGQDELFFVAWTDAVERLRKDPKDLDGWMPIFFCWLDDPDCRKAVPKRYEWGEYDDDERGLIERRATPEQLYFRRWEISQTYFGDVAMFKQEYPSTPEEAFQHSSRRIFEEPACKRLDAMCRPGETYALSWDPETKSGMSAEPLARGLGAEVWEVWAVPNPKHDYIVFGDVALGILCDPENERSDPDWSYGGVLDRVTLEVVATLRTRMDLGDFGEELLKVGLWYNEAWATCEMTGLGIGCLERMRSKEFFHRAETKAGGTREEKRSYGRLYRRRKPADKLEVADMEVLGWMTDQKTRPIMIRDIKEITHRGLHGWDNRLRLYDAKIVAEMRVFQQNLKGKPEARPGHHDDGVMMASGLVQLHHHCARQLPEAPVVREIKRPTGDRIGAVDDEFARFKRTGRLTVSRR